VALSYTFATTSGGNWLQVVTSTVASTLIVSINPFSSSLSAGVYTGTITVNQTLQIPVTLNVTTSLIASPTSLTFTAQQGGSAPPTQTINVSIGGIYSVPFTASASSASNWLSVMPASGTTPGALTVTVNPTGLQAATYTGSIAVSSSAASTVTIGVTLNITAAPVLTFAPATLSFQSTSAVPQPPSQTVSVFSNVPSALLASASITTGGNWLTVAASANQTPASLSVSANPGSLGPGTYAGQINISSSQTAPATPIPVTFTIAAPQPPTLQLAPDTITLSSSQGGLPINSGLVVTNAGGGTLIYSAQIVAQSGGNWLSLQATSGSAAAGSFSYLPLTVTPGTLAPGTYTASITVSAAGSQTATSQIILSINAQGPVLLLTQTGLAYNAVAQGANPPPQTVSIVNTGGSPLNWTVTTQTLSGGSGWLTANPSSGTTQPFPANPPTVTVSVNSQNLAPGTYYGSVNVNSQVISVQTTVLPAGQKLSPTLSTNGLVLTAVAGGANPAQQTITIFNPLSFTTTYSTSDGTNWLSGTPASGSISLQGTLASLTPGVRHGTLRIGFTDGSVQTVSVLAVVAPTGTSPQLAPSSFPPAASGSCPSVLLPQVTTPAANFSASAAQSVPFSVSVVDDCGHALANSSSSSVIASFYDASKAPGPSAKVQPDQRLTGQGNGVWSGTWTPQSSVAQLEIIVVALGINGTTPIAGQTQFTGAVHAPGANSPALASGIFNAASFQPGNTVALGSFVSIFGSSMADGSTAPTTQPLPTQVQGAQVLLGGVALPLQYAGPTQINALIPTNIATDTQLPLIVQRDLTQAAPTQVTIADSQPGIYTANQQGTGQGAVLTSDNALDAPVGAFPGSHPASRGGVIQVFCTGLGAVTNPPATGAAAPNSPLSNTVNPVTATIGGMSAPVMFSGLAPGFIGLYQVNVTVPTSAPVGDGVPLTLTVGSSTSNTATIAVQ
jgi:trimeric autotransporter adhesin